MNTINIWTDGSCINNGTASAKCGIGIYYHDNSCKNTSSRLPDGKQTNNRAELCAILYVLCTNRSTCNIRIITDSHYSIKCITEYRYKWESNGWKTSKNQDVEWSNIIRYICSLIDSRSRDGGITEFEHVRGHSGDSGNEKADRLAYNASISGTISGIIKFLEVRCNVPFS